MAGGGGNGVAIANDIVGGWVEEVKDYNYDNPGFGMSKYTLFCANVEKYQLIVTRYWTFHSSSLEEREEHRMCSW